MRFKLVEAVLTANVGHEAIGAMAAAAFAAVAPAAVVFGGKYHPAVLVKVVFVGFEAGDGFVGGTSGVHANRVIAWGVGFWRANGLMKRNV